MNIYIGHASSIDFHSDLYTPIRNSELNDQHTIILPHETTDQPTNTIEQMKTMDLMIAEVSATSTGLGIEMGWANALEVPVLAIHKEGTNPSAAIDTITQKRITYTDGEDLINKLTEFIKTIPL